MNGHRPTTKRWPAYDARTGEHIADHVRLDLDDGKRVHWEQPDGTRKLPEGVGTPDLALYGARELPAAGVVVVVEGEKAADALRARGILAVGTMTGAATIPCDDALRPLLGRTVSLWPDNDDPGREHMRRIAGRLRALGHTDVRLVDWPDAPAKGDAADFPGTDDEIRALIADAKPYDVTAEIHSDAVSKGVPSERILNWTTAAKTVRAAPAVVLWIARWWIAAGALTELDGRIKGGKTSWLLALIRAVLDGLDFMGEPTTKTPAVYLTEQPPTSFAEQLKLAGLGNREDLHVLYWHEARGVEWPAVVDAAIAKCEAVGARLLVVDTLSPFAGIRGDSENNAGAAQEALEPLQYAASKGIGVCIVRHERKGGGEVGDSGRGSSAFGGGVDIVLALKRPEGNVKPSLRVMHAISRFEATPSALVIDRTAEGYVAIGSQATAAAAEARAALLAFGPTDEGSALTERELFASLPEDVKRSSARDALAQLQADRLYHRLGLGVKGNPYRYYRSPSEIHSDETTITNRQKESNPESRGRDNDSHPTPATNGDHPRRLPPLVAYAIERGIHVERVPDPAEAVDLARAARAEVPA